MGNSYYEDDGKRRQSQTFEFDNEWDDLQKRWTISIL